MIWIISSGFRAPHRIARGLTARNFAASARVSSVNGTGRPAGGGALPSRRQRRVVFAPARGNPRSARIRPPLSASGDLARPIVPSLEAPRNRRESLAKLSEPSGRRQAPICRDKEDSPMRSSGSMHAQIGTLIIATSGVQLANGFFRIFIALRTLMRRWPASCSAVIFAGLTIGGGLRTDYRADWPHRGRCRLRRLGRRRDRGDAAIWSNHVRWSCARSSGSRLRPALCHD